MNTEIDISKRMDALIESFTLSISLLEIALSENDIARRTKASRIFTKSIRRHLQRLALLKANAQANCD